MLLKYNNKSKKFSKIFFEFVNDAIRNENTLNMIISLSPNLNDTVPVEQFAL